MNLSLFILYAIVQPSSKSFLFHACTRTSDSWVTMIYFNYSLHKFQTVNYFLDDELLSFALKSIFGEILLNVDLKASSLTLILALGHRFCTLRM